MRKIILFLIVTGLILAAAGIGVWTASKTTNHAKAEKWDTHEEGIPVSGGLFVTPPPIY
jgi:hypothetical protein